MAQVVNEVATQCEVINKSLELFMAFSDLYVQSNQNIRNLSDAIQDTVNMI